MTPASGRRPVVRLAERPALGVLTSKGDRSRAAHWRKSVYGGPTALPSAQL
ncbi:MAG: hypothetical protein J7601_05360 [Chloroflexi bacterium]|nr:hypothetical protein [Chloroflexota bacterium]